LFDLSAEQAVTPTMKRFLPLCVRFPRLDDLHSPEGLDEIVGLVRAIDRVPLTTVGFSQAHHERLTVHLENGSQLQFVLKRFALDATWTAYRTGDVVGREAALLIEPALVEVWEVFRSPFRAFAVESGKVGLLMSDLTDALVPDDGTRLTEAQEEALLGSLAALHARFWESDALQTSWLASLSARFHILHPSSGAEEMNRTLVAPVFTLVQRGWEIALQNVPSRIADFLRRPAEETAADFSHLPQTLLHGDTKVANFGFYAGGELAAFDWATMGRGPATVDLGYCLAINTTKLPHGKEQVLARYRDLLVHHLGRQIPPETWGDMVTMAIVAGAGMLLWSKALAMASGTPGAADEWNWWVLELERRVG
jgi:hypothetical protein